MIKHKNRIEYFRELRNLHKILKGSNLVLEKSDSFMPDWKLFDKNGVVIASLCSRHVWQGIWNHFYEVV